MPFIIVESPEDNIWDRNPSLELIGDFKKFKETEGEDRSSDILKAIFYIWDPKSDLRDSGLEHDKLIEDVTSNVINDPDFNWDDYEHIKELYLDNNLTKLEKLLLRYESEIEDLNTMLEEWKWNKKEIKARSEAVRAYKILFDEYIEIRDKARIESDDIADMLGGYQKSMIEDFAE